MRLKFYELLTHDTRTIQGRTKPNKVWACMDEYSDCDTTALAQAVVTKEV